MSNLNIGWNEKLPLVLQSEAAECGIACLVMVANFHGNQTDLVSVRRKYGYSLKGATLKDLLMIADRIGLAGRPLRLELDEMDQLKLPCVLHWDLNHFVVLKSVVGDKLVVHDPAAGIRTMRLDEVSRHFTGVALELNPTVAFEQGKPPPRISLTQLIGSLSGLKRVMTQLLALALAIEVISLISPFFLGLVIDNALVSADSELVTTLAICFTLLLILRVSLNAMRGWAMMGMSASLKVQSRSNLMAHMLNIPTPYFESRHLGDVVSRFASQDAILQAITSDLSDAVLDGIMAAFTLAFMFYFAPSLTYVVLIGAAIYGLLRWATYSPLRSATNEAITWGARRDSHFLETLRGIRAVKLFNGQELRRVQWVNLIVETLNRQLTADKLRLLFRACNSMLFGLLTIFIVWAGARLVLAGEFSVGLLTAFLAYQHQFLDHVGELINKIVDIKMLRLHAERLADLTLSEPEVLGDPVVQSTVASKAMSIEFKNVSYRYSAGDPWVLQGVSFRVAAGESVAICGPSGGGKSTLLKLLAGLMEPSSGVILIDGVPIKQVGLARHRARIGVVMQDDQLFAGSLSDNITFFAENPNQEMVEACARIASIHADIVQMPMAYGTLVGDMGTTLSGGQKQRILLARAIYRWPDLLLLDEATSNLDIENEKTVNQAMKTIPMTRLVIAHRPETIKAADRTIQLVDGQIAPDEFILRSVEALRQIS